MSKTKVNADASRSLRVLPDPQGLELQTLTRMLRVVTRFTRRMERLLAERQLSLAQFDVLATLSQGDGITQSDLSERLLVTKGNVCGLIDRAESLGLVERRPDPGDRRVNRLFLTDQGRASLTGAAPGHHQVLHAMMRSLPAGGLENLYELLGFLDEGLNQLEAG